MNIHQIKSIGNFLATYDGDLHYINNFQKHKRGELSLEDFVKRGNSSFYDFLIEFRIVRNFQKGSVIELLTLTVDWINRKSQNDVDEFALFLKYSECARNQVLTSLASKILFLNNP